MSDKHALKARMSSLWVLLGGRALAPGEVPELWIDDSLASQCGFPVWVLSVKNGGNFWFSPEKDTDFPHWRVVPGLPVSGNFRKALAAIACEGW